MEHSMHVQVHIVNAFIDGDSGGNPAGVVVDANGLSVAQKLAIAQHVGLSETAFISASQTATYKLEFFTPSRQIAHCGHATVAAFSLLRQLGLLGEGLHTKETIDGLREIIIKSDMAFMEQRPPTYQHVKQGSQTAMRVLAALGLTAEQLIAPLQPCIVNTGNAFMLVPLQKESDLKNLQPRQAEVQALSDELDLIGFYPFTMATQRAGRTAATRMFAPRFGISEEAGTGMAAGPLACYLHDVMKVPNTVMLIEQGWLMPTPSPSVIHVNLELLGTQIKRLLAGGRAKAVSSYAMEI
jgi:PhzF family phenazine biosynthesis protein